MNEDNPRVQCQKCGKWRRLHDRDGNQLMFPYYKDNDGTLDEIHHTLCIWCHQKFYGITLPPLNQSNPIGDKTE